jgi:hypothetical protein
MAERIRKLLDEMAEVRWAEHLLTCPECFKPIASHPPQQAYRCLRQLAVKEQRKLFDSLTKHCR